MIKKIARYCLLEGISNTNYGSWNIYFEDIMETFEISIAWIAEHADDIAIEIYSSTSSVLDIEIDDDEDYFSINFCFCDEYTCSSNFNDDYFGVAIHPISNEKKFITSYDLLAEFLKSDIRFAFEYWEDHCADDNADLVEYAKEKGALDE